MIGRNGERRSGISAQTARHDDDEQYKDNNKNNKERLITLANCNSGNISKDIQITKTRKKMRRGTTNWKFHATNQLDRTRENVKDEDNGYSNCSSQKIGKGIGTVEN